jgi:hypothetical protein
MRDHACPPPVANAGKVNVLKSDPKYAEQCRAEYTVLIFYYLFICENLLVEYVVMVVSRVH